MQTARATAQAVEGLFLMGITTAMVSTCIPMIGAKMAAMVEPIYAVLGQAL